LTSEASAVGGFYAINRRGQVLLATVNEAAIVPFVSGQVCFLEVLFQIWTIKLTERLMYTGCFWSAAAEQFGARC